MKSSDIRELSDEELRQKLADSKKEMFDLRVLKATGEVESPLMIRTLRRDVAKIKTVMKQRGKA